MKPCERSREREESTGQSRMIPIRSCGGAEYFNVFIEKILFGVSLVWSTIIAPRIRCDIAGVYDR